MTAQRLTILQLHNVQSQRGGADIVIERETQLLVDNGHRVIPFFLDTKEELARSKLGSALKALWNRAACRELRRLITAHHPDLVHVHTPYPVMSPAVFRAASHCGIPTVATLHSHRMICVNALFQRNGAVCELCVGRQVPLPAVRHRCYHNSLAGSTIMAGTLALHHAVGTFSRCIDRYIALSPFAKTKLVATGFPEDKIRVRPNFVPPGSGPGLGQDGGALFVGRMVPEKGIHTLVRAWQQLASPPRLTIIGDGPGRADIEPLAARHNIEITGWLPSDEVRERMRRASLVVFPSEIYEAGPLVLIESYSCGTPVLASDVGNFSDQVIDGQTGYKFQSGNPEALANQVRSLFATPEKLASLRPAVYAEYQRCYTPEASYRQLLEIYEQARQQRAAGR